MTQPNRKRSDSPTKTCTEPGCDRPLRARGLCGSHYNRSRYTPEQRHAKVTVPCDWCAKPCIKEAGRDKRYGGLFCSLDCRTAWSNERGYGFAGLSDEARAKGQAAAREARRLRATDRRYQAKLKLKRAARGHRGRKWVAGQCRRCGQAFVAQFNEMYIAAYCRNACKRTDKSERHQRRKRAGVSIPYSRYRIFVRDGWRCHICRKLTSKNQVTPHPRAPTIDHLVPLSEGGDDTPANVATACFLCNCTKRECGGGEQLALIG